MTPEGKRQFEEQMKLIPQMRTIAGKALGPILFTEAPPELDMKENSDLVILKANDIRVACRLRGWEYIVKGYLYDVTIRAKVRSGLPTEIHKVLAGFGTYFFYGFHQDQKIKVWRILDLECFRELCRDFNGSLDWPLAEFVFFLKRKGLNRCGVNYNPDGTGLFYIGVRDLFKVMPEILIESNPRLPPIQLGLI